MKKILVAVKRVIDYNARVRVKPDKVCHGMVVQRHVDANMNFLYSVETNRDQPMQPSGDMPVELSCRVVWR